MIYFDGCANHLGCTVMLRGASASELKKVNILIDINLVSGHLAYLTVIFSHYPCQAKTDSSKGKSQQTSIQTVHVRSKY